jgi:hypothetical protein
LRRRRTSQKSAQQRFSPSVVRKTGERRFAFFSRSLAGPIWAGIRLFRRAPSLLADKILFYQKSVTAAIDSTERACGLRPCR